MAGLKLVVDERREPIDVFTTWLPRIAVALAFFFIGKDKFAAHSMWIRIFDQIGFGQWFRYVTGALQMGGAVLVMIPRTFRVGILMIACTLLGAVLAWLFLLHAPGNAVIPGLLLVAVLAVGSQGLRNG
jgi:uncharacterized membrane protein